MARLLGIACAALGFCAILTAGAGLASAQETAKPAEKIDLSRAYPSGGRCQANTKTCHAWAAQAVLGAGVKLLLNKDEAAPVFSTADLFVRRLLLDKPSYQVWEATTENGAGHPEVVIVETGDPYDDLEFMIGRGVAMESSVPWDPFIKEYEKFKEERNRECLNIFKNGGSQSVMECLQSAPMKEFLARFKAPDEKTKAELAKRLLGESQAIRDERKAWKERLGKLEPKRRNFTPDTRAFNDPAECRSQGAARKDLILSLLRADPSRPVAVCLHLQGLERWRQGALKKKNEFKHCVAITGYSPEDKAAKAAEAFSTLNSWGVVMVRGPFLDPVTRMVSPPLYAEENPDIDAEHLCRVHEIVWLEL